MSLNFDDMIKGVQEMYQNAQAKAKDVEVTAEAGAGLVRVTMGADRQVKKLELDSALWEEEPAVAIDLICAAFNKASQDVDSETQKDIMSLFDTPDKPKDE